MTHDDPTPPVADDDFPEFAAPPRSKPAPGSSARAPRAEEAEGADQAAVDEVIARIKQRRSQGNA